MNTKAIREYRVEIFVSLSIVGLLAIVAFFAIPRSMGMVGVIACGFMLLSILGFRDVIWHVTAPDPRADQLRAIADQLGFQFTKRVDHNPLRVPECFLLTQKGVQSERAFEGAGIERLLAFGLPSFTNYFEQSFDEVTVSVFDFTHAPDGDDQQQQTVFAVRANAIVCPHVAFCPTTITDKLGSLVSSRFETQHGYRMLTADTPEADRILGGITPLLQSGMHFEFGEGYLLMYQRGLLVEPSYMDAFIRQGLDAYTTIVDLL